MVQRPRNPLLDRYGHPLRDHLQQVLWSLVARLLRQFPVLRDDDVLLTEVLEEAGRRIAEHEGRVGAIERLRGYSWVTLRNVATSRMGRQSLKLARSTLPGDESRAVLSTLPSQWSSSDEIERDILFREVLTSLAPDERLVCVWKMAGFSSQEIAAQRRSSVGAVDALFWRVKQKIRRLYAFARTSATQVDTQPSSSAQPTSRERKKADEADG